MERAAQHKAKVIQTPIQTKSELAWMKAPRKAEEKLNNKVQEGSAN